MPIKPPEIVAAVDLGSNSFHMIVCSLNDGKLQTIDRLREMVRLASGLDANNVLDDLFKAGELPEEAYQQRRSQLKEALNRQVGKGS